MHVFKTIKEAKDYLNKVKNEAKTVGFVPTMGALHKGHVSLIERAIQENDISVSSIFVNPLQFNNKKDLEKYPRTLNTDLDKLKMAGCDVVFVPSVEEMYPGPTQTLPFREGLNSPTRVQVSPVGGDLEVAFDLGNLDKVMEGAHRPGHFQGVCAVVKKLFDIVEPARAYFGEKDFQQLAVIKHMVKTLNIPVEIIPCPTLREADGLAMSSRNALLSAEERKNAGVIYRTMEEARKKWKDGRVEGWKGIEMLKTAVEKQINANAFLKLEYFEIVDAETLQPVTGILPPTSPLRACIAVKAGAVRLIDNIPF